MTAKIFTFVDPYEELGVTRDASKSQIKGAYRKKALQLHPDRMTARNATAEECAGASEKFAALSSAYALLSDDRRRREYDHIYKYGGFDHTKHSGVAVNGSEQTKRSSSSGGRNTHHYHHHHHHNINKTTDDHHNQGNFYTFSTPFEEKVDNGFSPFPKHRGGPKERGVGYCLSDPLSSLFHTKSGRKVVAGIQLPTRLQKGMKLAFSHGEYSTDEKGTRTYVSTTTQYAQGKKFCQVETTTVFPDGQKEILLTGAGNNLIHRRILAARRPKRTTSHKKHVMANQPSSTSMSTPTSTATTTPTEDDVAAGGGVREGPWYVNAWNNVRDQLTTCHSPCGQILVS